MIYTLIEMGSLTSYFVMLVSALLICYSVLIDEITAATFLVVISFLAIIGFTDANIIPWAYENMLTVITFIVAYVAIGIVSGYYRWNKYSHARSQLYNKVRKEYMDARKLSVISDTKDFDKYLYCNTGGMTLNNAKPLVRQNKMRIMGWMAFWPVSSPVVVIVSWLKSGWEVVYRILGRNLQKFSDRHFKNFEELQ